MKKRRDFDEFDDFEGNLLEFSDDEQSYLITG
jgi:hypothetical protein